MSNLLIVGRQQSNTGYTAAAVLRGDFLSELLKNLEIVTQNFLAEFDWGDYIDPVMMFIIKAIRPEAFTSLVVDLQPRCQMPEGLGWEERWNWEPPEDCPVPLRRQWCQGDIPERQFGWFRLSAEEFFQAVRLSGQMVKGWDYDLVDQNFRFGSEQTWVFAKTGGFVALQRLMALSNPYVELMRLRADREAMATFLAECKATANAV